MIDQKKHKNNPILPFALECLEFNGARDNDVGHRVYAENPDPKQNFGYSGWGNNEWVVSAADMKLAYLAYCESKCTSGESATVFNKCFEFMTTCRRVVVNRPVVNKTTGNSGRSGVRCWNGCRLKDSSGFLQIKHVG